MDFNTSTTSEADLEKELNELKSMIQRYETTSRAQNNLNEFDAIVEIIAEKSASEKTESLEFFKEKWRNFLKNVCVTEAVLLKDAKILERVITGLQDIKNKTKQKTTESTHTKDNIACRQDDNVREIVTTWQYTFSGSEDLDHFLSQLIYACDSSKLNPEKILPFMENFFKGTAKIWHDTFGTELKSWPSFCKTIRVWFQKPGNRKENHIQHLKEDLGTVLQKPGESIREYFILVNSKIACIDRTYKFDEATRIDFIYDNLLPVIKKKIVKDKKIDTMEKLLVKCMKVETELTEESQRIFFV